MVTFASYGTAVLVVSLCFAATKAIETLSTADGFVRNFQSDLLLSGFGNKMSMEGITAPNLRSSHTKGWLYAYAYPQGESCSGQADFALGIATSTCLVPTPQNNTLRSYFVTCTGVTATISMYNGAECNPQNLLDQSTFPLQSCAQYSGGYRMTSVCGTSDSVELPEDYVLTEYYQMAGCASSPVQFAGVRNNACVSSDDGQSARFEYPNIYVYRDTTDCSGSSPEQYALPGPECAASETPMGLQFPYQKTGLDDEVPLETD